MGVTGLRSQYHDDYNLIVVVSFAVQCHLLNIDTVTQFDPQQVDMLKECVYKCTGCIKRATEKEQLLLKEMIKE